ncbi:MAG: sulfotransferase family protein [Candidatus Poribacteria bacterium]|nr:sulfotransferase family protein [Candidatus Poribacteria bacterium]
MKRICLWSSPRNVSTALMYSFAQRADMRVLDEPLYAHYLRVSGADHPDRERVIESMESDGAKVIENVVFGECDRPVLFMKQMTHHLVEIDRRFLERTVNVLLTRDPVDMLPSLGNVLNLPTLRDTGYAAQHELLEQLRAYGQNPSVIDSRELLNDPRGVLSQLCARLGIPFDEAMLSWEAGARPEDGVWAPHWYASVHQTTGFQPYRPKTTPFPPELKPLLEECRPYYDALYEIALKAKG